MLGCVCGQHDKHGSQDPSSLEHNVTPRFRLAGSYWMLSVMYDKIDNVAAMIAVSRVAEQMKKTQATQKCTIVATTAASRLVCSSGKTLGWIAQWLLLGSIMKRWP